MRSRGSVCNVSWSNSGKAPVLKRTTLWAVTFVVWVWTGCWTRHCFKFCFTIRRKMKQIHRNDSHSVWLHMSNSQVTGGSAVPCSLHVTPIILVQEACCATRHARESWRRLINKVMERRHRCWLRSVSWRGWLITVSVGSSGGAVRLLLLCLHARSLALSLMHSGRWTSAPTPCEC